MTPSNYLFDLIKSMSKGEKMFFKKFSRLHVLGSGNDYLLLFSAIEKQKHYDEKKIIEQLKKHNFIRHFAVMKNYLYSRLMDALEIYYRNVSIHAKVRRNIHRAELLQKKGLYEQAYKALKKTKKVASEAELFPALMEIQTLWEPRIYVEEYDLNKLESIHNDITRYSLLLRDIAINHQTGFKMVNLYYKYQHSGDKKFLKEAEKFITNPYFIEASKTKTFTGRNSACEAKFFYYYAKGNLNTAYKEAEAALKLYESNTEQIKSKPKGYITWLNNLFAISMEQEKYMQANSHLEKLKAMDYPIKTFSEKARFFYLTNSCILHYLCRTGKASELEKRIPPILHDMKEYNNELNDAEKIELQNNIAIAYYCTGNLKQCISILNILRNEFNLSVIPEVQDFVNFFYIITHYDVGNTEMLPHLILSYHRYLNKKKERGKAELIILNLLRTISKIDSEKKLKSELSEFKYRIKHLQQNMLNRYAFKFFDLLSWIESKIENRSFAEVVREKAKA